MANKTSRRLVALSAAAITTIYAAGFAVTRSADAGLNSAAPAIAAQPSAIATSASSPATAVPTATSVATATAPATITVPAASATTAPAATAAVTGYKDGTFTGQGTSRRGGLTVAVSVQSGAITNVQITSVNTEYPVSRIASLPGAVVKQQTANVNVVSGATYSSQAFKQAVQQALTLAQA
jgi:uncharacterized protein with FMN-binding domain